jgi:CRISPR system Cascade subunit CasB
MSSYLNGRQKNEVRQWWKALQPKLEQPEKEYVKSSSDFFDRGHRARLRRAPRLEHVLLEKPVFQLLEGLGEMRSYALQQNEQIWLPLLAGTLANVENGLAPLESESKSSSQSLARRLGMAAAKPGSKTAPMSELRFQRMMKSSDPEDFYLQIRRALRLANGTVDVATLAEDVLAWYAEHDLQTQPANAMRFRWARDYYQRPKDAPPADAIDLTPASESIEEMSEL